MLQNLDIKLIFSVIASVITVTVYYPYIRDIFLRKTKPHIYTWLIWMITIGIAVMGSWQGGGNFGAFSMSVLASLMFFVFLLSFKYGTKDITKIDTLVLIIALSSIVVWWGLDSPILAVLMVSVIDGLGYIPTYRKSFKNPYEESLLFWAAMVPANILMILALAEYNFLTASYLITIAVANIILVAILFIRRKIVLKENKNVEEKK